MCYRAQSIISRMAMNSRKWIEIDHPTERDSYRRSSVSPPTQPKNRRKSLRVFFRFALDVCVCPCALNVPQLPCVTHYQVFIPTPLLRVLNWAEQSSLKVGKTFPPLCNGPHTHTQHVPFFTEGVITIPTTRPKETRALRISILIIIILIVVRIAVTYP